MMRRGSRVDANHPDISKALTAVGALVVDLSAVGKGCPDLLVSFRGIWYVLEIKDGEKSPSRRTLTPAQEKFHAAASAANAPIHIVLTVDDALRAIGATS
jgi:hypothetical protein